MSDPGSSGSDSSRTSDAGRLMDGIYRSQRHIYDATRKYYLLGRDGLIADLDPPPGARILEIGCGTGRNLIKIARTYPHAACHGLDISSAMLETACKAVLRAGLDARITLAEADATAFDPLALFGVERFDRVVISYALSMIPPWQAVLRRAAPLIAPGGFAAYRRLRRPGAAAARVQEPVAGLAGAIPCCSARGVGRHDGGGRRRVRAARHDATAVPGLRDRGAARRGRGIERTTTTGFCPPAVVAAGFSAP